MSKNICEKKMILGENAVYSLDCYETRRNNNVVVVGAAGAGKTRGIVEPNILEAVDSYVISDPKGNLYRKYKNYLRSRGYKVMKLDFKNPKESIKYNVLAKTKVPGNKAESDANITKFAKALFDTQHQGARTVDPFWDEAASLLLTSLVAYLRDYRSLDEMNFASVVKLINALEVNETNPLARSPLDRIFDEVRKKDPTSFALRKYNSFRVAADKTIRSIQITTNTVVETFADESINSIMSGDDLDITSIGKNKTALFICASDTERTYDVLVNVVFTQIMNELVRYADSRKDCKLPIPVRFIMDDFATNVRIAEFPRIISSVRSRGISTMILIQAESQLEQYYEKDARTILGSCDTYVYMGGGDIETAACVAKRADKMMKSILNMPVGYEWVFRRGEKPLYTKALDLDEYVKSREYKVERAEGR